MIVFRTSVLAALALLLTLHARAQTPVDVPNDSSARSPFHGTLHCATFSEQSTAETGPNIGTATDMRCLPKRDLAAAATLDPTSGVQDPAGSEKRLPDWRVDLYPVFAWAPVFGASASVHDPPSPLPAPAPSGNVSGSFNGAAFAGFAMEKRKWSASGNMLWAGLSGQRQTPFVRIDTNFIYGQFMLGREVLPHLFAEAGFRRTAIKIAVRVSTFPQVIWKPGVWDPLVGLTYRRALGHKWQFRLHGDGGGFGVGNDVSVSGTAAAEWHFVRHFELLFGYGFLYFRDSGAIVGQPIKIRETLHGPMFGFGIHFGRAEAGAKPS
jgi:hypothetical protein